MVVPRNLITVGDGGVGCAPLLFLGRKVYLFANVLQAAIMRRHDVADGTPYPKRSGSTTASARASWGREDFTSTRFWKVARQVDAADSMASIY
jgi:hypothetical protein